MGTSGSYGGSGNADWKQTHDAFDALPVAALSGAGPKSRQIPQLFSSNSSTTSSTRCPQRCRTTTRTVEAHLPPDTRSQRC
ncbi:hypothetical protein OIM90_27245 [Streptomyces sp. AD16]|nr:hypothetical protein OIM90_27245 [Streptomyces sp. AD16]